MSNPGMTGPDDQARAERARLREVGDVTAMDDVEHAVREDQRPRQLGQPGLQLGPGTELGDEGGQHGRIVAAPPP